MPRLLHRLDGLRQGRLRGRLRRVPGMARIYRASRAPLVREQLRFAATALAGVDGPRLYNLRDGSGKVVIRQGPSDVGILAEFFWFGEYEPPEEAEQALRALGRPIEIADLGGHVGIFGVWARARWPGCRIVSVEAEPENAAICARTIAANGAAGEWELIRAAASTGEGTLRFSAGRHAQSAIDPAEGNIEVRAIDVLPLLERADLVKIDIEGGEWPIVGDPRFAELGARVIAFEFHPHLAPGPDPRLEMELALDRAGFSGRRIADLPDGHGIGWAWRKD